MTKLIILTSILFSQIALGLPTASILKLKGEVLYNGKPVTKKTLINENGLIEIKAKSYLKIKVNEYKNIMMFGPNSKLVVKFKKKSSSTPYSLVSGLMRWTTMGKKPKRRGMIKTKTAIIGVRGTDFIVVANPLLNETEIICFDGKVIFINRNTTKDKKIVGKNQWGGIGGRFGESTGKTLTLPKNVINHFKGLIK